MPAARSRCWLPVALDAVHEQAGAILALAIAQKAQLLLTGARTLHDLRHTMTSLGIEAGTSTKVLASRLGHSTDQLVSKRYGHVLPGVDRSAALAIETVLKPKKKTRPKGTG